MLVGRRLSSRQQTRDTLASILRVKRGTWRLEIAKALMKAGGEALVLKTSNDEYSCLYFACQQGHREIAEVLINVGREVLVHKTTKG